MAEEQTEFQRICLAHYHEIGLKGHNRATFENRLLKNLEAHLKGYPLVTIHRISGRLLLFLREGTDYATAEEMVEVIRRVPGVARVSCGYKCERDLGTMTRAALLSLEDAGPFASFRVTARRNHTDFPIRSMEMNRLIGSDICDAYPEAKVQMKGADVEVGVEVVEGSSYVYAKSVPGIGGLPVGCSGKVMCLMSSGIDSPVAAWRIARRGAICTGIHFSGRPQTSDESEYLVDDIAHVLEKTGCMARIYVVPFGDYQRRIAQDCPPSLRIVLYRRLMFMIAERVAVMEGCGALVTGESLGQVASQTLENIGVTNAAVSLPVLRPLIGTDKLEIIKMAKDLGTYDISSIDAPDCCTLFMPRKPETHARLDDVLAAEAEFPYEEWIGEIIDNLEIHDYACPAYKKKKAPKPRCDSREEGDPDSAAE